MKGEFKPASTSISTRIIHFLSLSLFLSMFGGQQTPQGHDLWFLAGGHRVDVGTAEHFLCKCITDHTMGSLFQKPEVAEVGAKSTW